MNTNQPAPDAVRSKRAAHELNDTVVRLANPTARYRKGYKFESLEIVVWAVAGDMIGHNAEYGECWGKLSEVQA